MAVIFYDNFTDTNNTNVASHTPDGGGAWLDYTPTGTTGNQANGVIISNRATNISTGTGHARFIHSTTPSSPDYGIKATIYVDSLTVGTALLLRAQTSAYTTYMCYVASDKTITIYRVVAGSFNAVGTVYSFSSMSQGNSYEFDFSVSGTEDSVSLVVKIDGTTVIERSDTSASRIVSTGYVGLQLTGNTGFDVDYVEAYGESVADGVTVTQPSSRKVFQRSGTSASVPLSGQYTGEPTAIQCRVVEDGTSTEVVEWTTIDASPSDGEWSGSITVPQGGWYNVQVRQYPDDTITSEGTNPWGVGSVYALAGQSNASQWFNIGTGTPESLTSKHSDSWAVNTGAGAIAFANAVANSREIPVALIDGATSGASLTADGDRGLGYWLNLSGVPWTTWTARVTAAGGEVEGIIWLGGEADALESVDASTFSEGFATLISRMRSHVENASVPVYYSPLGRSTNVDADDAGWNTINDAYYLYSASGVHLVCDTWDLPLADTTHYSADGYAAIAGRFSNHILGGNSRGPAVTAIGISGTTVDITVSHVNGDDIAPSSSADGFRFTDDGDVMSATVARVDATTFRATLASAPSGALVVYVAWGRNPTATDPARDDAGYPVRRSLSTGISDLAAPILTIATATATGATTATASVSTDDGNGTLYFLASTNATESAATIKAALSQSVTATGSQSISLSGLDAETTYYVHFVHVDAATNESNVISTASFTTSAVVYPSISATTASADAHSVTATVTTSAAGGTIYGVLSTSATAPEDSEIVASPTDTADVTDAGDYELGADELDARTTYYWHIVHVDGDDLASDVLTVPVTTQDISIALAFADDAPCSLMAFLATSNLSMSDAELKALLDGE